MSDESLLDLFAPPPGLTGQVAFLMAMSGSPPFLEAAVRRFTGLGRQQRLASGLPVAFLALDAHPTEGRKSTLSPLDVPGLLELQPLEGARAGLLHAKLAVLAFGESRTGPPAALRLVVPTGNWTNTSARHLLELYWRCDVSLGDEAHSEAGDRADLAAAARFARRVLARYDCPRPRAGGLRFASRLHDLLGRCVAQSDAPPPRFIHSLDEPLFDQLKRRLHGKRELNVLLCGSGSYEQGARSGKPRKPAVLTRLEPLVNEAGHGALVAVIEPGSAGAMDGWAAKASEDGSWSIRLPLDPYRESGRRALHAKFVFVGHAAGGRVHRGLLYLGSGNLSHRGFLRGRPQGGNLECGALLEFKGPVRFGDLAEALYVSDQEPIGASEAPLVPQPPEPDDLDVLIDAPPLRGAVLVEVDGHAAVELHWSEGAKPKDRVEIELRDGTKLVASPGQQRVRLQSGWIPSAVRVTAAGRQGSWLVPVEAGPDRLCVQAPQAQSFADALDRLLEFPPPLDVGEVEDEEAEGEGGTAGSAGNGDEGEAANPEEDDGGGEVPAGGQVRRRGGAIRMELAEYPLQKAMVFLERMGDHQVRLEPHVIDDWLHHLEGALVAQFTEEELAPWRGLGIPFGRALQAKGFCPRGMKAGQRQRYREIVRRFVRAVEGA